MGMCSIEDIRASVDWERMPGDPMYQGNEDHYRGVGESALKVISGVHLLANKPNPLSILDFACATGRVTRWLRAAYPSADLEVADINPEWMAWSAKRFGATGWVSSTDFSTVQAPGQYDLIWCGSLVTHIPAADATLLIGKFHDWLKPSGIAVVTTHGRKFVSYLLKDWRHYFANDESTVPILAALALKSYGFVPYSDQPYGISVNRVEWLIQTVRDLDARLVAVSEHTWDDHHDIVAFQRAG